MCTLICSFIFTLATVSSVVSFNDIAGHDIVNLVWENNSHQQEVDNNGHNMDCNTGQSMEEENKEANSQQALDFISEGTIGSNADYVMGSSNESYYAEFESLSSSWSQRLYYSYGYV